MGIGDFENKKRSERHADALADYIGSPIFSADAGELQEVFDRIVPLVQKNIHWWRNQVRLWTATATHHDDDPGLGTSNLNQHTEDGIATPFSDRTIIQHTDGVIPVPFPEHSTLSELERTVLLAAIYDRYVNGLEQINPFADILSQQLKDVDRNDIDKLRMGLRYRVIVDDRVPALRQHWRTHKAAVEAFIDQVAAKVKPLSSLPELEQRANQQQEQAAAIETQESMKHA